MDRKMNVTTPSEQIRYLSRKLFRELGMLQLNNNRQKRTPQHWHSLIEISRESKLTISRLGQLLLISTSAASRIVNALVKDDFVTLLDGADRREKYLQLTEKGRIELNVINQFSKEKIKGAFEF